VSPVTLILLHGSSDDVGTLAKTDISPPMGNVISIVCIASPAIWALHLDSVVI